MSTHPNKNWINNDSAISIAKDEFLGVFYLRYYELLHRYFLELEMHTNDLLKQSQLSHLARDVAEQSTKQQIKLVLAITACIRTNINMSHGKMSADTALKELNSELDSLKIDKMDRACLETAQNNLQSYERIMQTDTALTSVIKNLLELSNTIKFTNTVPMLN